MTQDQFKVKCWNEFIKQDKKLNEWADEGTFAMDMARIMPNDFENLKKVCNGDHEGECFHSWEQFIISQFEMKEEGRGDFYKFIDDWFIMDGNHFLVSEANADYMIRYIIENGGIDMNEWDETQNRFKEYFERQLNEHLNGEENHELPKMA